MESCKLRPGIMPAHLKLGRVSLRAPIRKSPEYPYGSFQVGVAPGAFRPGMLSVEILGGNTPERVEILRTDISEPERNIQVEVTREEDGGPLRRRILAEPIAGLALVRTKNGWEAQSEDMIVEDENGLNIFATVVMSYAANKRLDAEYSRPANAAPEV